MKYIFFVIISILTISCKNNENQTIIKGNIPNLPDGIMYLSNPEGDRIDSAKTIKGVFTITHKWNEKEPTYIKVNHIDKKGILRFFFFTTNAKYKGTPGWSTDVFYSDTVISLHGKFKENPPIKGYKLPYNIKDVSGVAIKAGRQTEAYYNIDGDLFDKIDGKMIQTVKEKINKYPYSYHLLYQISDNKNSFSPQQVDEYLKLFKGDITQSETYKKLSAYNQKRFNEKNISIPLLENSKGVRTEIIDQKYKKHLIIFWASWCGPCREEIPLLKKMYPLYNNETEFISISIDSDKSAWQKALKQENMTWKQLFVSDKGMDHEALQIHFKLNQAIPYTILIDNNMKILSSSTGLSNEEDLKKLIK